VTADPKRPTGPPPSAGVLARYAQAYARELGVAEGRVRAWVAYMILAGVLEQGAALPAPPGSTRAVSRTACDRRDAFARGWRRPPGTC